MLPVGSATLRGEVSLSTSDIEFSNLFHCVIVKEDEWKIVNALAFETQCPCESTICHWALLLYSINTCLLARMYLI